jgi:large subunit ribosomal protein L38
MIQHKSDSILVQIDLDTVKAEWYKTGGPFHIRKVAEHYGVFNDLFGRYAYFTPRVPLTIKVLLKGRP